MGVFQKLSTGKILQFKIAGPSAWIDGCVAIRSGSFVLIGNNVSVLAGLPVSVSVEIEAGCCFRGDGVGIEIKEHAMIIRGRTIGAMIFLFLFIGLLPFL